MLGFKVGKVSDSKVRVYGLGLDVLFLLSLAFRLKALGK